MDTATLINGLDHPDAKFRLHIAHVNGLVEETRALPALHRRHAFEKNADVRCAIGWAGRRVLAAQYRGYNTLDALFEHYRITHELAHTPILSTPASAVSSRPTPPHTVPSAAVNRIPARQPSAVDVRLWIDKLMHGENDKIQHNAALMLADLNNPAALPYLGWVFAHQTEQSPLAQTVQRVGKLLYWGVVYWQMTRDGTLQQEIDLRRQQGLYRPTASARRRQRHTRNTLTER